MSFESKTRDQIVADYQRAVRARVPDADVGPGTQPFIDACTVADALMPIYANSVAIEAATKLAGSTGSELDADGRALGIERGGPGKASGYVVVSTGPSGANVIQNMELVFEKDRSRYRFTETVSVATGTLVGVEAKDGGPLGNRTAGDVLIIDSPTPGLHARCVVFENSDGSGLTGGALAQDDDEYRRVLLDAKANPAIGGNVATYTQQMMKIPSVGMQAAFAYPAIKGPGTVGIAFTMRPARPGASRLPNGAQLANVAANLLVNEDDGVLMHTILDQPIALRLALTTDWVDAAPWPAKTEAVTVTTVTDALHVRVTATGSPTVPLVGKSCAFYDPLALRFRTKRIAAITNPFVNVYDLTFEAGADENSAFVPTTGRLVSAASPRGDAVIRPVLEYVDRFGPGEAVALFTDEGHGERRHPEPTAEAWPNVLTSRVTDALFGVVQSASVMAPALPLATTVGVPGVSLYLMRIADIAISKE